MIFLQGEMDDYKKIYFNTVGAKDMDYFVLKDKLGKLTTYTIIKMSMRKSFE